jgi:glycosyltransferase involved in cell wall biosynthesis
VRCFATQGRGSDDEARIATLLEPLGARTWPFDRGNKLRSAIGLIRRGLHERPSLIVMEGTGVAGGAAVLLLRALRGIPYVVSSGDAVGPYVALRHRAVAPLGTLYERALYRRSAGFVGWSPYLVGRALALGAPRAMTAANWASTSSPTTGEELRSRTRARLGVPPDALVFGLVGSLQWSPQARYCYGLELVRAVRRTARDDVRVLIVGGGSGRERLEAERAGDERVLLTGKLPREDVAGHLAAMDVASLPQRLDGVGAYRYTTKLSEYLDAGLPVVTGRLPLAYDLDGGWLWRLPGTRPWDEEYVDALAALMRSLDADAVGRRRRRVPSSLPVFDRVAQQSRLKAFLLERLEELAAERA